MQKNIKTPTLVAPNTLLEVNEVLSACCNVRRWSSVISTDRYDELSKQAFNCAVSFFIAHNLKQKGYEIDFVKFPKIAISRLFEKREIGDLQESMLAMLGQYDVPREQITMFIQSQIAKSTSEEFKNFLFVDKESIEAKIHRFATKIATLLELYEIKLKLHPTIFAGKQQEILCDLKKWNEFGLNVEALTTDSSIVFEMLSKYSSLRNRMRWAKHPSIVNCSVLGHQMDTALLAYLHVLEINPKAEKMATKLFWMGIFHDFPEAWTGDMPSPLKDAIPGLRKATEQLETDMMQENVYSKLPAYMSKALKAVMLEEGENSSYKPILKNADNMSANMECWRQLYAGSHSEYFKNVLRREYEAKETFSPCYRQLLERFCMVLND